MSANTQTPEELLDNAINRIAEIMCMPINQGPSMRLKAAKEDYNRLRGIDDIYKHSNKGSLAERLKTIIHEIESDMQDYTALAGAQEEDGWHWITLVYHMK